MTRLELGGPRIDYEIGGEGPPVVFVHARPFVSWYRPLLGLLDGWTHLHYERLAPDGASFGVEDDAALCSRLLVHLGLDRPHVVGHSYGGLVALELARQGVVEPRSVALLEPATSGLLPPDEAATGLAPLLELARRDGPPAAMAAFLRMVGGDDGADGLERCVPGALDEAAAHAEGFFGVELPAVVRWTFGADDAARIGCPVLNLLGAESWPRFARGAEIVQSWFPGARRVVLPDVTHLLMAQAPDAVALALEQFWAAAVVT